MSEELRAKGYLHADGSLVGDPVGPYSGFLLSNTTFKQLLAAHVISLRSLGSIGAKRPDGLVMDYSDASPRAVLVVEHKDVGELTTEQMRLAIFDKLAKVYCKTLDCPTGAVTDGQQSYWISVDLHTGKWLPIRNDDGYAFDVPVEMGDPHGRDGIARALAQIHSELDPKTGILVAPTPVDPTDLADRTWQKIWLASGGDPEVCLATFVEILIFKFLSDIGILRASTSGVPVDFASVRDVSENTVLRYYFDSVRPEVKRLFPPGDDGTSVINGFVLDPDNRDHNRLFARILEDFAGTDLRHINPEFKSRVFERFLRNSIGIKNWGQYFTPRAIVKAMVEMSGIDQLPPGAKVNDPACGVGGFLLEPLLRKRPGDFRVPGAQLAYSGWDRDSKTIILAKANMLIHLSEALDGDPTAAARIAPVLNETFSCFAHSVTGSLREMPREQFDLILTNPPYVVSGSSTQREVIQDDAAMRAYYSEPGVGMENLFLQMIINALRPGAHALVIVPDGLLARHQEKDLKKALLRRCCLEAIISLPVWAFYSTPKRTYILIIRKKRVGEGKQEHPVLTGLVSHIGETLDVKRFPIPENDLVDLAAEARLFLGAPDRYREDPQKPRIKLQPISDFAPDVHWLVDKWWDVDELRALGALDADTRVDGAEIAQRLEAVAEEVSEAAGGLSEALAELGDVELGATKPVRLSDKRLFRISIGKRVLKRDLHGLAPGPVPLYSANVTKPFGHVGTPAPPVVASEEGEGFGHPSVLFGIDEDFAVAVKQAGEEFAHTDHCGRIEVLDPRLDPRFVALSLMECQPGFNRSLRASKERVETLSFPVPVLEENGYDTETQKRIADRHDAIADALTLAADKLAALQGLQIRS
jgi:type I restriction enzyme M protein